MQVTYRSISAEQLTTGTITFLPSGQVLSSTPALFLSQVNVVLAPTISYIQGLATAAGVTNFNFWELMNWLFVSQYWLLLLDFGQIAPSTFQYTTSGDLLNYGPVRYSATNNIFVNDTLFEAYNSYLRDTVLPLFTYTLADFYPLNATNQMNATTVSLKMLYTCSDIRLKDSAGLIISVIVADWGMISSVLTIGLFILAAWRLRREPDGKILNLRCRIDCS